MAKPTIQDQLEYVRERIKSTPTKDYSKIAAGADVAERTLYHIRKPDSDPRYSTVNQIYTFLKATEPKPVRAKVDK